MSPAAVKSDWVNDEIDAAIELRRRGSMQTLQFVIALPCEMPLLLSSYKRVVAPDSQPYPPRDAAVRVNADAVLTHIAGGNDPPSDTYPWSISLAPEAPPVFDPPPLVYSSFPVRARLSPLPDEAG